VMVNQLGNKNGLTLVRSMTMNLNIYKETNNYVYAENDTDIV
jgi:hypothetical protein